MQAQLAAPAGFFLSSVRYLFRFTLPHLTKKPWTPSEKSASRVLLTVSANSLCRLNRLLPRRPAGAKPCGQSEIAAQCSHLHTQKRYLFKIVYFYLLQNGRKSCMISSWCRFNLMGGRHACPRRPQGGSPPCGLFCFSHGDRLFLQGVRGRTPFIVLKVPQQTGLSIFVTGKNTSFRP